MAITQFLLDVTYITCGILNSFSLILLISTVAIYVTLNRFKKFRDKIILILIVCCIAHAVMNVQQLLQAYYGVDYTGSCTTLYFYLYFYCSQSTWLFILTMETWIFSVNQNVFVSYRSNFKGGLISYAIVVPIFLTCVPLIAHHTPGDHLKPFFEDTCFFRSKTSLFIYFFCGLLVLCGQTIVFLILTFTQIRKSFRIGQKDEAEKLKLKYKMNVYLFFIVNVTGQWSILVSLYHLPAGYNLAYLYTESIAGTLIFLVLVFSRKRIRRDILLKLGLGRLISDGVMVSHERNVDGLEDSHELIANDSNNQRESLRAIDTIHHPKHFTNIVL